jgi:hypothetical protein
MAKDLATLVHEMEAIGNVHIDHLDAETAKMNKAIAARNRSRDLK